MNLIPTVIEINTLFKGEFKRRSRENWIEFIRYWYYLMTHNKFNKSSSGFVSASKEILELGGYYETKNHVLLFLIQFLSVRIKRLSVIQNLNPEFHD